MRPPCYFLLNLLLTDSRFPAYLTAVCTEIARTYARSAIGPVVQPDATCHSLFPLQCAGLRRVDSSPSEQPSRADLLTSGRLSDTFVELREL